MPDLAVSKTQKALALIKANPETTRYQVEARKW